MPPPPRRGMPTPPSSALDRGDGGAVDWYFDARDSDGLAALRHEFRDYLSRHAEEGSDVAGAEIAFSELITNATRHAPGPALAPLDWSPRQPVVEVHALGPGFEPHPSLPADPLAEGGRG